MANGQADSRQYLTFMLGEEVFALDIEKVREVIDYTTVTKVPQTPDFMRGVINLRGNVVPVVDLRLKFGMSMTEKTVNTCVIFTEVALGAKPCFWEPWRTRCGKCWTSNRRRSSLRRTSAPG